MRPHLRVQLPPGLPPVPPCAQMKKLEAMGLTREQAEALTRHLTTVLCINKEKLEEMYASKVALEKASRHPRLQGTTAAGLLRPSRVALACILPGLCHATRGRCLPSRHVAKSAGTCPPLSPGLQSILEQEAKHAGFRSEVLKSQELQVPIVGVGCGWWVVGLGWGVCVGGWGGGGAGRARAADVEGNAAPTPNPALSNHPPTSLLHLVDGPHALQQSLRVVRLGLPAATDAAARAGHDLAAAGRGSMRARCKAEALAARYRRLQLAQSSGRCTHYGCG